MAKLPPKPRAVHRLTLTLREEKVLEHGLESIEKRFHHILSQLMADMGIDWGGPPPQWKYRKRGKFVKMTFMYTLPRSPFCSL